MFDPLVKTLATWYSHSCPSCGVPRIEAVVNNYKERISCPECRKRIFFGSIILKVIMMYTKMDSSELRNLSSDKEAMACINALSLALSKQGYVVAKIGAPLYVVFDVTRNCNLRCIHCYSSEKQGEMATTDVYHILDMLSAAGAGVIDFGGGEPLLRKDIFDILCYSKKLGLYSSISTNGTLLDEHGVKQLKALNIDHVCISLDGAKPETHDHIRNEKGTYEKTIRGINTCVHAGITTQISTVFMNNNINELKDMYTLLESLHVNGWYIYDFVPAGRGKELQQEVLTPEQRKRLFEYLQDIAPSSKITLKPYPYLITINSACGTDTYFYKKYGQLTEFFKGCLSGRWVCYISSNGDLYPCHLLHCTLGNLRQEAFEDIWYNKNNPILKELRDRRLLKGSCGKCSYRDVCGGCRAQAFWRTDDYLEGDSCWVKN